MKRCLFLATFCAFQATAYDIWDYGRECKEEIGVELPKFSCLDPHAFEIPVTQNGKRLTDKDSFQRCDVNPSVLFPCTVGDRLLKYTDFLDRNGRRETVTTLVMCRRAFMVGRDPQLFHDIAVIQHNEMNNRTCWFHASRKNGTKNASALS